MQRLTALTRYLPRLRPRPLSSRRVLARASRANPAPRPRQRVDLRGELREPLKRFIGDVIAADDVAARVVLDPLRPRAEQPDHDRRMVSCRIAAQRAISRNARRKVG